MDPALTTWERNAPTQVVLDSIFAALAGVLIVTSVQDVNSGTWHRFIELLFSFCSFVFLARSAEGTTTAMDERDVDKYVYYLLWYNVGVVLLIWSLAILIYGYFSLHFFAFCSRFISCSWIEPVTLSLSLGISYFILFLMVVPKDWLSDVWWIITQRQDGYSAYINELRDVSPPEPDPPRILRLISRLRSR
jgi:hypothetical protein